MNVKTAIEWLKEYPDDYEINLSQLTSAVFKEDGEDVEYFITLDDPVVGMMRDDDTKEVRLFTKTKEDILEREKKAGREWRLFNEP